MLKKYVWRTGDFLETAGNSRFWEKETREILLISGRKLLSQIKGKEGELYISLQNLIRPLLIIFREFEDREEELQQWSPPESQKLSEKLKNVFRLDSFETRFALRMSVVPSCKLRLYYAQPGRSWVLASYECISASEAYV